MIEFFWKESMRIRCIYRAYSIMRTGRQTLGNACHDALYTPSTGGNTWMYCHNPERIRPDEFTRLLQDTRVFMEYAEEMLKENPEAMG